MAHNGVFEDGGLGEKFKWLGTLFRRFSFPSAPDPSGPPEVRNYWKAISTLNGYDSTLLDRIAEETCDEWDLQIAMGRDTMSDNYYLVEFVRRLNVTIDEMYNDLLSESSASQVPLSQFETELNGINVEAIINCRYRTAIRKC